MESILERDNLGAFCRHTHSAVKGIGAGPLAGLAFGAKDIYDIAGYKSGFGSPEWLATHEAAARTAPAVQRLLEAGAAMIGKTQTDELAFSLNGENPHYGTPVNVNAPGRIPGGSSSGSAAAVAGGLCDFALGSDTGGSVRAPASFCGIYGMRPTHGRVSLEGVCPLAPSFDTAGWFARDAGILERVGRVLLGEERAGAARRLLLAQDAFAIAGNAVAQALQPAVDRLSALLGEPQAVTVAEEGLPRWFEVFRLLQGAEIWAQHGGWVSRVKPHLGPGVKERMQWVATIDSREVGPAKVRREKIGRRMNELLAGGAVLALPTVPGIAPLRNTPAAETDEFRGRALSLLCIAGLARLPQASLPVARIDGCPIGLSIIAARGGDMMLLALAKALK
ncbi:MAG: amidase [Betaproteobacteria bacterium RIFCSPLOWO2_12_FULL_62_13]|nr:MAG: amidase [Betaproteobacteria bacterium RIFCSPLOWO2_12_FULL_62_13]